MIFKKRPVLLFSVVLLLAAFASCSASIEGTLKEGGAADLDVKTSLGPRTVGVIRSLRDFLGGAADAPVLDGAAIGRSMSAAPGVRSAALGNTGPQALEGVVSISGVGDFLAQENAKGRFIVYTEGRAPGTSSIIVTLDRDSAPELIARLSPDVEEYLAALMAPAVSGEESGKEEYLEILTMVYGRGLAEEVAAARVRAAIEFPRLVTVVKGGRAAGKRAEFDIPILDLLVLENPLRYEIFW